VKVAYGAKAAAKYISEQLGNFHTG
jgi:hypothetical protein